MKTLPILLLALVGAGACKSAEPRERHHERAGETQALSVIPLQYAVAAEVANALTKLRPDTRVVADERTNSVIVACASEADMRLLSDCIAKLDIPATGAK